MVIKNKKLIIFTILTMVFVSGCSSSVSSKLVEKEESTVKIEQPIEDIENIVEQPEREIDLLKVKPNEAGQVMVLMYHSIAEPEGEWSRTPENFRKDLQTLYDKGYRPISLKDFVAGNITTEAGYTPVVLTFDDGWQNNFNMIQNEKGEWIVAPDCAVGILEEFHKKNPDFPMEATFFINDNIPFGQKEHLKYKFQYIIDKGMDIGNHTATHVDFTDADAVRIQKELAGIVKLVNKHLPNYEVNTLALPSGTRPQNKALYQYLETGTYGDIQYKNIAILNVGWDPSKSPYHKDFDPLSIHRIRASELQKYVEGVGMYDWLHHFDKGTRIRYISDGDPDIVTIPENYKEVVDISKTGKKEIRTYKLEND